jgi:hypothetical protein
VSSSPAANTSSRLKRAISDVTEYFDEVQDVKITKDMLDLAKHIVEQKSGRFKLEKFEDHYEAALAEDDATLRPLKFSFGALPPLIGSEDPRMRYD